MEFSFLLFPAPPFHHFRFFFKPLYSLKKGLKYSCGGELVSTGVLDARGACRGAGGLVKHRP